MSTVSERDLVKKYGPYTDFTVMETGSAHTESSDRIRKFAPAKKYFGVDMQPGPLVDIQHDLEKDPIGVIPEVDVVFCFSLLEHTPNPWRVAENLQKVLKPGGLLLLSVPFQWRYHGHPKDYYRYTFDGIEALFLEINFFDKHTDPSKIDLGSHQNGKVLLLAAGRRK